MKSTSPRETLRRNGTNEEIAFRNLQGLLTEDPEADDDLQPPFVPPLTRGISSLESFRLDMTTQPFEDSIWNLSNAHIAFLKGE